ncbi:cytochrome c oxidase assembly protein [Streptomyces sp. Go-475]|uniref:cytochrome c oxidase assembly protein n=1 Tax=Streptomyces sp. Go-475 TaxID=2072505 RepID=UPI000DEF47A2|nr:cytochrome c oxidase assembly protein [Streptomyces sp. Go-475]AXE85687.1 Cytochrome c oxidase caa3 assembly factor [Streptomyces sp. Go-475]
MTTPAPLPVVVLLCCLLYTAAAARLRHRGDRWPLRREAGCWLGGGLLVAAFAVPWEAWLPPFTAHTAAHVTAGMVAPLPFVLARPVTLALRALPRPARRVLVSSTRSGPVTALVFPPVAAALDVGGLWLLYRGPLPPSLHHSPLLLLHLFLAGLLFTFALLAVDPVRHRPGFALRAGTLLAAAAAHAVLAKGLWATGPPGTAYAPADLHLASQLMYYGGDAVEIALALLLASQWYRAQGRSLRPHRGTRQPEPAPAPGGTP